MIHFTGPKEEIQIFWKPDRTKEKFKQELFFVVNDTRMAFTYKELIEKMIRSDDPRSYDELERKGIVRIIDRFIAECNEAFDEEDG